MPVGGCPISKTMSVTVIIPFKEDRGWLDQAIASVPKDCQLILAKGDGNKSQNFNKVLNQVKGDFIRVLDEDDMLTENCIDSSLFAIEGYDFIHGNALQMYSDSQHGRLIPYIPPVKYPTLVDLLEKNVIHNMTTMYRREVFEKVGGYDESLKWAEDYEFHLRCLSAGLKIGYCNSFLCYYRIHSGQITEESFKRQQEKMENRELIKSKYR